MLNQSQVLNAIEAGAGILRLEPCWVPREFLVPGRRLKLHPDDIYAFGGQRGGIDERWFSSTIKASNGPLTRDDEGITRYRRSLQPDVRAVHLFSPAESPGNGKCRQRR